MPTNSPGTPTELIDMTSGGRFYPGYIWCSTSPEMDIGMTIKSESELNAATHYRNTDLRRYNKGVLTVYTQRGIATPVTAHHLTNDPSHPPPTPIYKIL